MKVGRTAGWPELKIGIVGLAAIAMLLFFLVKMDSSEGIFSRFEVVQAKMRDLRGLRKGSPVHFSGVVVGNVDKIRWQDDGQILLILGVKKEIRSFIKTTSHMTIETMGVLGDKYVKIHAGAPTDPTLPEEGFLQTEAEEEVAGDILMDSSDVMKGAKTAVDRLNEVLRQVRDSKGTMGKFINEPTLYNDIQALVKTLNDGLSSPTTLGKLVHDRKLYDELRSAAAELAIMTRAINEQQGSMGKLVHDAKVYDNLNTLTQKLNGVADDLAVLVKDVKANPKRYFSISVF